MEMDTYGRRQNLRRRSHVISALIFKKSVHTELRHRPSRAIRSIFIERQLFSFFFLRFSVLRYPALETTRCDNETSRI